MKTYIKPVTKVAIATASNMICASVQANVAEGTTINPLGKKVDNWDAFGDECEEW